MALPEANKSARQYSAGPIRARQVIDTQHSDVAGERDRHPEATVLRVRLGQQRVVDVY